MRAEAKMKISICVSDLNAVLKNVSRAVDAKGVSPWMSGILLETDGEDKLVATATNGMQTITQSTTCTVSVGGKILLDGKLFTSIASKLPNGDCEIDATSGKRANIKMHGYSTNLSLLDPSDFVSKGDCVGETKTLYVVASELINAFKTVFYAMAVQDTRAQLIAANMCYKGDKVFVCGLNGFQFGVYGFKASLSAGATEWDTTIPRKCVSDIMSLIPPTDKEIQITTDGTHAVVTYDNISVKTILVAGAYINYQQIIKSTVANIKVMADVKQLKGAVERVMILCEGKNRVLRVYVNSNDGTLTVAAKGETGDATEQIECPIEGGDIEIAFNGQYVLDALGAITDEKALLTFDSPVRAALLKAANDGKWLHCLLPVRTNN